MANKSYKGRRFEIEVAGRLSLWWTGGERDDVFWHTHDSGGRATKRTAKGKGTKGLHGDICAVDPIGAPLLNLFVIECKKGYSRASLHDLLDAPAAAARNWQAWINKAEASAEAAGTAHWMIVAQRDRREPIVVVPNDVRLCSLLISGWVNMQPFLSGVEWHALRLEDWLLINPTDLITRLKEAEEKGAHDAVPGMPG